MLKPTAAKQHAFEMVTLEELVPKDHLLRLIDQHIDFGFIRAASAHLYSADNGRPAIDPVQLFKLLFVGYLFGVRSERRLVQEVQVNVPKRGPRRVPLVFGVGFNREGDGCLHAIAEPAAPVCGHAD